MLQERRRARPLIGQLLFRVQMLSKLANALVPQAQAAHRLKDGRTLVTLKDAAELILSLPVSHHSRPTWLYAAQLLKDAAEGKQSAIAEVGTKAPQSASCRSCAERAGRHIRRAAAGRRSARHRDRDREPRSGAQAPPIRHRRASRSRHPRNGRGSGPSRGYHDASSETAAACGGHRAHRSIGSIQSSPIQFNAKSPDGPGAVDIASGSVDVSTRLQ